MEEFPKENNENGYLLIEISECNLLRMPQMRKVELDGIKYLAKFVPVVCQEFSAPQATLEGEGETPEQSFDMRRAALYRSPTPEDFLGLNRRLTIASPNHMEETQDHPERSRRIANDEINVVADLVLDPEISLTRSHISNSVGSNGSSHQDSGIDLNIEPSFDVEFSSRCPKEIASIPWLGRESENKGSENTEDLLLRVGALEDLEEVEGFENEDSSEEGFLENSDTESKEDPEDFLVSPRRKKKERGFQGVDLEEIRNVVLPIGIRLGLTVQSKEQEDRIIRQLAEIEVGSDRTRKSQRKTNGTWNSQKHGESSDSSKSISI